jgi:putative oxidoreductase
MKTQITQTVARVIIALLFISTGLYKATEFNTTSALLAEWGMPLSRLILLGVILLEVGGGLVLLLGHKIKPVTTIMIGFVVIGTLLAYVPSLGLVEFSQYPFIAGLKNLAIIAGLILIRVDGGGIPVTRSMLPNPEDYPSSYIK